MNAPLLPHVSVGHLFGLVEAMSDANGSQDIYRLAERVRLRLDGLHPLLEATRLLGWARVEGGDYGLTAEGLRVAQATVAERKALFRAAIAKLPIIASILDALAPGQAVPRETILAELRSSIPSREAERQVNTAVDWGRWAELYDYDADAACFLAARRTGRR